MPKSALAVVAFVATAAAGAREPTGLHSALQQLTREGKFSGAVVVRGAEGVRFARGCGPADPFTGRAFTPDTPVDSASLAKPVTAAAVLFLAREGRIDLDAPVQRYLPEYPHEGATVRQLLSHSAGLPSEDAFESVTGRTNADFLAEMRQRKLQPLFAPGSGFSYCNFCYTTLALLIERVSSKHYLTFVRERVDLPRSVTLRPLRLRDWSGRAIGYIRTADGKLERADSYEGELFYGTANLSISAAQLAEWGSLWWKPRLAPIRSVATTTASIAGKPSGLTLGNWYCAEGGRRCHYLGHHEGFHHMLYWDGDRQISLAMVTNNSLEPALQQRLQRALVAFAEGRPSDGRRELVAALPDAPVSAGRYRLSDGEGVAVRAQANAVYVTRRGVEYRAYRIGEGIRYVPGLDVYLAGASDGRLHWLGLYEDFLGTPVSDG